ncbi:MAG TPA: serine kinase [Candidatus Acetothermia bacterium]|nr:serine kinase [Candidatus Acetothermia bacterium]
MELGKVITEIGITPLVGADLAREVLNGYCSDLLSDVLAHAQAGDLWITHQRHLNVVAVARLRDVAGIVFPRGLRPSADVVARAEAEGVNLLLAEGTAFEVAGKLYRVLHP